MLKFEKKKGGQHPLMILYMLTKSNPSSSSSVFTAPGTTDFVDGQKDHTEDGGIPFNNMFQISNVKKKQNNKQKHLF